MSSTSSPQNKSGAPFSWSFLLPRYWATWILLGALWVIMWLPRKWVMRLGSFVGDQMRLRNAKRRHIVEVNIALCFPELGQSEKDRMVENHFRCYGQGLVDMGLIMMATKERIKQFSEVRGLENLTEIPENKNIILVTYHTTTLDMFSSSMLADIDLVSMMKRDRNPVLNWFLHRSRTRYKRARIYMRDESLRGIVEGMNEGRLCYLIPDEDFGDGKHAVFAPFFGRQRSTLNIISRLARKTNAAVLPGVCRLIPQTGRYITTISPPLEDFPGNDNVVDATRLNRAMENLIREAPEQYLWTFKWFKTRPDGQENPYKLRLEDNS